MSERYALIKRSTHPGKGLLIRTGALRQAASRPDRVATARELILRIDDPKLRHHQSGNARMPARPLVFGSPLPPDAARELEAVATSYIRDLLHRV
ncbi:MAG: hypothetical protein M3540_07325 [Actinomycetota bacterium]|nr:hypothetical protein [Actinomycetota bacterium]